MENINAALRFRPLLENEIDQQTKWSIEGQNIKSTNKKYSLLFNGKIFDSRASNRLVYQTLVKPLVLRAVDGYNGIVFASGQTGSGKTYTLAGDNSEPGIVAFAVRDLLSGIKNKVGRNFRLKVGYIEILNEVIYDLLDERRRGLDIHEWDGHVMVNQKEFIVESEKEIRMHFDEGNIVKKMSGVSEKNSKRSQTVFCITIHSVQHGDVKMSNLFFVDLADSEQPLFGGSVLDGQISKSFLSLRNVAKFLSRKKNPVEQPSVRECKLLRILTPSIDEKVSIALICTVSPTMMDETFRSVCLAHRMGSRSVQLTVDNGPKPDGLLNLCRKRKRHGRLDRESVKKRLKFEDNTELMFKEIKNRIKELEAKVESVKEFPTKQGLKAMMERYDHEIIQEAVKSRNFNERMGAILRVHRAEIKKMRMDWFELSQKLGVNASRSSGEILNRIADMSQPMQQGRMSARVENAMAMYATDKKQDLIAQQRMDAEIDQLRIEFQVEKYLESNKHRQQEAELNQLKKDLQASKLQQERQQEEIKAMLEQMRMMTNGLKMQPFPKDA